ncbi:MAG: dockerin type I repeat-containing protein [Planctomycetota bacterium]
MRAPFCLWTVLLCTSVVRATPPLEHPLGPPNGGTIGVVTLSVADTAAPSGAVATVPFLTATEEPYQFVSMSLDWNPAELSFLGVRPAAGFETYADLNGEPICDVVIYPNGRLDFILLADTPYSSDICGDSLVFLDFEVSAAAGSSVRITLRDAMDVLVDDAFVHALAAGAPSFLRGDVNSDGLRNLVDAVFLLLHLLAGGDAPSCVDACDLQDDGAVDLTDAVLLLAFLFGAADAPQQFCGYDLTSDGLPCLTSPCTP